MTRIVSLFCKPWRIALFLVTLSCVANALAQHPFYVQAYDNGVQAMTLDNRDMALEFLEIAAFGLLEHPEYLKDIYIRTAVLLHEDESQRAKFMQIAARVKRLIGDQGQRPERVDAQIWDRYLIAVGRKKPPLPPVPKDESKLREYTQKYPRKLEAWQALVDIDLKGRETRARQTLADALEHHPKNVALLEEALTFAVNRDRKRSAADHAEALYKLNPGSAVVMEYYGVIAADQDKWDDAERFLKNVGKTPILRDTADALAALDRQRKREADQKAKEDARIAKLEAQKKADDERARQKELDAEKARLAKLEADKERLEKEKADEQRRLEDKRKAELAKAEKRKKREASSAEKEKPADKPETRTAKKADPDPIQILETRLRKNRNDLEARYDLAELYLDRKDLRKAGKELRRLGNTDATGPRYTEVYARYNYLAERYKRNIDLKKPESLSNRAKYFVGMSYFRSERLDEAVKLLKPLSRTTYPDLKEVDKVLEETDRSDAELREQSVRDRSIQQLERRVKRDSAKPIDKLQLIGLYLERKNYRKAAPLIEDGVKQYRANQDFRYYAGRLALYRKKYGEAYRMFHSLINAGYRQNDIYFYGGMAAMKDGQEAAAEYLFKMAVRDNVSLEKRIEEVRSGNR
ncbi:tetratricopeptide repeat protein [Acanthopleuribacter pedis]|uniref:Tetratricopeptide repeat protein n=1 Tax=Acanthopleuribacter pedis TaxID=442870 RepID=A0A8J7QCB6_9BACT|nr:tetratricopeptide repeat protein [Acanthopleuribacter pedis]MBO1321139.1 hypothetical protein [Acanthopleuribacter pedis]